MKGKLLVLVIEIREIDDQIFDYKQVRKRSYGHWSARICINRLETCYCINAIYVHGA